MKLLVDNADLNEIKAVYNYLPIDGVTTNPSILAAAGRPPYEVLEEIRSFIGPDAELHVQVVSDTAEGMIEEAGVIREKLGGTTYVKIPMFRKDSGR